MKKMIKIITTLRVIYYTGVIGVVRMSVEDALYTLTTSRVEV